MLRNLTFLTVSTAVLLMKMGACPAWFLLESTIYLLYFADVESEAVYLAPRRQSAFLLSVDPLIVVGN